MERLVVIVGAGASHGCASDHVMRRGQPPPLVTGLFGQPFHDILATYPLAQSAAAQLRRKGSTPVVFEQFVRERFRDSDNVLDQRIFMALPYYLQHLLWHASRSYTHHPDNYDLLVQGLMHLPHVDIITLNYDTLLDNQLGLVDPLNSMADYVGPGRKWAYYKLHGSVDWGHPIQNTDFAEPWITAPPSKIAYDETQFILRPTFDLEQLRRKTESTNAWLYPALSVPVGEDDELACPEEHVAFLRRRLAAPDALHLLVIGYSGNDREVIRLLTESETYIASLYVVNRDAESAAEVRDKLRGHLRTIPAQESRSYKYDFSEFVQGDEFDKYLQGVAPKL